LTALIEFILQVLFLQTDHTGQMFHDIAPVRAGDRHCFDENSKQRGGDQGRSFDAPCRDNSAHRSGAAALMGHPSKSAHSALSDCRYLLQTQYYGSPIALLRIPSRLAPVEEGEAAGPIP
jgi:hypothetical protein